MNVKLLVIVACAMHMRVYCQEEKVPNRTVLTVNSAKVTPQNPSSTQNQQNNQGTYPITISVNQYGERVIHDKKYYQDRVTEIDETINAIDVKINYVASNSAEHTLATQNGWYEDMEATKEKLYQERSELLLKIESFN